MNDNKYIPVQMIGTQRSGSNLLRLMLNELEDVVSPHPPHILERFFPLLPAYGNLKNNDNFEKLVRDVCKLTNINPVPWNIKLDPGHILGKCTKNSLIEVFKVVYDTLAEQNNKKFWCCKSLANVHFVNKIEAEGLKPYYIYLYRDGRDVALSFKKAIVGEKHVYSIAKQWKEEQELALKHCEKAGPERCIKIRYEDFIADPETTLQSICTFLNTKYRNKALEYYDSEESRHTAESGAMWQNVVKPVIKNNFDKYLTELSLDEIYIFEAVAGETLRKLDYKTMYYSSYTTLTLNDEHINEFLKINGELKLKILESLPEHDILKRKPQNDFINSIKSRLPEKNT